MPFTKINLSTRSLCAQFLDIQFSLTRTPTTQTHPSILTYIYICYHVLYCFGCTMRYDTHANVQILSGVYILLQLYMSSHTYTRPFYHTSEVVLFLYRLIIIILDAPSLNVDYDELPRNIQTRHLERLSQIILLTILLISFFIMFLFKFNYCFFHLPDPLNLDKSLTFIIFPEK